MVNDNIVVKTTILPQNRPAGYSRKNDYISEAVAEAHEKKYGFYPAFEMEEIDYDDPVLDIYKDDGQK